MTWSGEQTVQLGLSTSTPAPLVNNTTLKADRTSVSRQKSCNACVRGKRRCDKRTPNCTRCAARGLDCVYQRLPPSSAVVEAMMEAPSMVDFDLGFDMDGISTDSSPSSLQTDISLQLDPVLDFSIADLVSDSAVTGLSPDRELWTLPQDFGASKMDLPPIPTVPQLPLRDLCLLQDLNKCEPLAAIVAQVHDPTTKIGYVVKYTAELHTVFARTRVVPFMHPRLWSSNPPKIILSAFSASTAQLNMSPENKGWTFKLVMDASRDIYREGEVADTTQAKLARVQAALIVLGMKMFQGDLIMRASGDREMSVLLSWTLDLLDALRRITGDKTREEETSPDHPPETWDDWILAESIRRTLVWSFTFTCFIAVIQSNDVPYPKWAVDMPYFTASRRLWEASSSVEFFRAWREKQHFAVKSFAFADFWQYARADDLDEFTRVLLISQTGPDALDQFFSESSQPAI